MSCKLDKFPPIVPDLSEWKWELLKQPSQTGTSVNIETFQGTEFAPTQEIEDSQELWELAKKWLLESWQADEVTAREDTAISLSSEADKAADGASEVLQDKDCSTGCKAFQKAKDWYQALESTFGKIVE